MLIGLRWGHQGPKRKNVRHVLAIALLLFVCCFDNLVFLSSTCYTFAVHEWDVQTLRTSEREVLDWMDDEGLEGVLASSDKWVGYLSATYTSVNPFAGHKFNTPDYVARNERMLDWLSGKEDSDFEKYIDHVLIDQETTNFRDFGVGWKKCYENEEYCLLYTSPSPRDRG